jgi:hypothetical protein
MVSIDSNGVTIDSPKKKMADKWNLYYEYWKHMFEYWYTPLEYTHFVNINIILYEYWKTHVQSHIWQKINGAIPAPNELRLLIQECYQSSPRLQFLGDWRNGALERLAVPSGNLLYSKLENHHV